MKRILILLLLISTFSFSGGEISFRKQKEKIARKEQAELEAIRNGQNIIRTERNDDETEEVPVIEEEQPQKSKKKTMTENIKNSDRLISYIKTQNPKLSEEEIKRILTNVWKYSKMFDFNPYIVLAVMNVESHFRHSTVSTAGAKGLMQLMPFNFKEFGVDNTIEGNIKGGIAHLKRDYSKTGSLTKTLVCYNAGCSRLENDKWKQIRETREYIPKVLKKYEKIMRL